MQNNKTKKTGIAFLAVVILSLNSCIGISMDIQMNRDGSGRLTMEYRLSRMLDNIGRLDGNESMPPIPAGRQDWERTTERINGTKLVSHSVTETAQDTTINAAVDFSNPQALTALLASSGSRVSIDQSGGVSLTILNGANRKYDDNLMALMNSVFSGYNFSISFSAPGNSTMTITDGEGNTIPAPSQAAATTQGRKVSLSMGIMDLIGLSNGLGVRFGWQ